MAVIREVFALIYRMHLTLPTRFILLDRAIATLGSVGMELYPDFNVFEVAKPYARELMIERFTPQRIAARTHQELRNYASIMRDVPYQLHDILQEVRDGQIEVGFRHQGLEDLIGRMDTAFNRIGIATVAVGGAVRDWEDAARALQDAADTAASVRENRERPWHDASEPDVDRLLWVLRDSPDLRRFAERRLAPLLDHDVRRKNKLLPTLDALCEHNWQKAAAARALHLQRQALYHRVERIARLLAADLEDPRTRFGLDLAVRAHRNATRGR
jgi:sugar diacid utilization regulator